MTPLRLCASALMMSSALLLVLCLPLTAGIPSTPTEISTSPNLPRQGEPVELAIGGVWSDSCVPAYGSHQVTGAHIAIVLTATGEICGQVETPWAVTVALGELAAGAYDVEISGVLNETYELFVARESWYLPAIRQ
ncbi:MAG: hypothetical protein R2911_22565 [Caldilineaceae bacterium]